ncbi:MAG: CBS domain-containing protein [Myxococcota bacterium]
MPCLARDVMQTEVVSVRADMPLSELEGVLLRQRIHGAPVVEGNRVIGVVSRSDVVRRLKFEEQRLEDAAYYLEPFDADQRGSEDHDRMLEAVAVRVAKLRVRDIMIEDVLSVAPDATLQEVAKKMLERPVHRMFVMEEGALLGLISSLDLLRLFAEGKVTAS